MPLVLRHDKPLKTFTPATTWIRYWSIICDRADNRTASKSMPRVVISSIHLHEVRTKVRIILQENCIGQLTLERQGLFKSQRHILWFMKKRLSHPLDKIHAPKAQAKC